MKMHIISGFNPNLSVLQVFNINSLVQESHGSWVSAYLLDLKIVVGQVLIEISVVQNYIWYID